MSVKTHATFSGERSGITKALCRSYSKWYHITPPIVIDTDVVYRLYIGPEVDGKDFVAWANGLVLENAEFDSFVAASFRMHMSILMESMFDLTTLCGQHRASELSME